MEGWVDTSYGHIRQFSRGGWCVYTIWSADEVIKYRLRRPWRVLDPKGNLLCSKYSGRCRTFGSPQAAAKTIPVA